MTNTLTIGKRIIPLDHIALIEAFDPEANPRFQPAQDFRSRVVLLNRDSVLALTPVDTLAKEHGFSLLAEDAVAANPAVYFGVESFTPAEGFAPTKPYATRLKWRDLDGNDQSKLLLTAPDQVLALMTGERAGTRPAAPKRRSVPRRRARVTSTPLATQP
jgi:hypothetical protein